MLPADPQNEIRIRFATALRRHAKEIFDDACNLDMLADQDVQRIMIARKNLWAGLSDYGDLGTALNIVPPKDPEATPKPKRRNAKATEEATT